MIAAAVLAAALSLGTSGAAKAQEVSWSIQGATAPAQLGVPVAISGTVSSNLPQDLAFDLAASTNAAYAASASFGKTALSGGRRVQPFSAEILPLAVGQLTARLACAPSSGAPVFKSPPILINVAAPSLPKNAEPMDIKAPRAARPPLWPWLLLAALLAAGYALYRWRSNRRQEEPQKEPLDLRPPEVIAEEGLAALARSGLWDSGRYKDFYGTLTDIVKLYLERRLGFAAPRMTSSEILRSLRQSAWEREITAKLRSLLDRADLVKFAKIPPEPGWGQADIASALSFVRETTPRPVEMTSSAPPKTEPAV